MGLVSATCDKNVQFIGNETVGSNGLLQVIDTVMLPPGAFRPPHRPLLLLIVYRFGYDYLICCVVAALICPDQLFWVEQRGEGRVGFDGYDCRAKGSTTLSRNEEKPVGIAVDSSEQLIFWSNDQNAKPQDSWLTRVFFNGTGLSQFIQGMYDPQGQATRTSVACMPSSRVFVAALPPWLVQTTCVVVVVHLTACVACTTRCSSS